MENHTIEAFKYWNEVTDYESTETTVTLLNKYGEAIAEFNYSLFTTEDFDRFKALS